MSAANGLPRVWVSRRRVYIQWPQFADTPLRPTAVIQLGTPLNEILAWPKAVPETPSSWCRSSPRRAPDHGPPGHRALRQQGQPAGYRRHLRHGEP
jgi:hypothetical protein